MFAEDVDDRSRGWVLAGGRRTPILDDSGFRDLVASSAVSLTVLEAIAESGNC